MLIFCNFCYRPETKTRWICNRLLLIGNKSVNTSANVRTDSNRIWKERFKMNSFKKKVTAFILIIATLALVVPYHEFTQVYASSSIKEASKMNASDYTSSSELAKKLTEVFEGNIGLYSSTKFTKPVKAPLGCSKMTGRNQFFIKANSTGAVNSGWQCYIYANAVYNTLYNEYVGRGGSLRNSTVVISGGSTFSYRQFAKAGVKCGAYVRTTANKNGSYHSSKAHSFVILGYDEESVTYIEGNGDGRGLVRAVKCSWTELNKSQTTGRGRYICHVVQPTDKYFNSLYGTKQAASSGSAKAEKATETKNDTKNAASVDPSTIAVKFSRTLSYAKNKKILSGNDVLYMQTSLSFLGYSINTNAKYDSATANVVKQFQKDKSLTADGKIGSKTWSVIENDVNVKKINANSVTVKYNANGGSKAPASQKVQAGKSTALTKNVPVRSGYKFEGWAKSKKAAKADYAAGAKVTFKADTTLYAVWSEKELKITSQPADVKVSSGADATFKVAADGCGLKYQWYYKKAGASVWSIWTGHNTASTTATSNDSWDGMQVYCSVTNSKGDIVLSDKATVSLA